MVRAPTPAHLLTSPQGRPYFLWDVELTLDEYLARLRSDDDEAAYWLARALRDAKPDDVLDLVDWPEIARLWPRMQHRLGRRREFWSWWLAQVGHAVDP